MLTAALATSAADRTLAVRMRADLVIVAQRFGGRRWWAVKDPVSLKYFHLRDEECFVLRMLDGRATVAGIRERYERRFAPRRLDLADLQGFLARLHAEGLVVLAAAGQGAELLRRHRAATRREWQGKLLNVLAFRCRGLDPDSFLTWLHARVGWVFHPWVVAACVLLMLAAAGLCALNLDELLDRLPDFQGFFNARNAALVAVALALTKVLHELGHGLACKHFGGECREMGVMLLVMTPCLYCNVSDAWMLPDKWRRIAISAAGMYVELTLASICVYLWWFSEPGLLNALCLNLVVVCSVSTLLFNGNPLLRYDGYYILSDLTETPNLAEQSTGVVRRAVAQTVLGIELSDGQITPERGQVWLGLYATASFIYRGFLLTTILWFLHRLLEPYGAAVIVQGIAVVVLSGFLLTPLMRMAKVATDPARSQRVSTGRLTASLLIVCGLLAVIAFVPLPFRIAAPAVLEPAAASRIYVTVPGVLRRAVAPGEQVEEGQTLAVLENREIELEIARLRGERDQQHRHLEGLQRRRVQDAAAAALIPAARQALADSEERLRQRQIDQERLVLTAPLAGSVLPPHRLESQAAAGDLAGWSGTPLDTGNLGCWLDTGTLLCMVGDPDRLEATAIIDQSDVEFVTPGQRVGLQFDLTDGQTLWGTVREVARLDLKVAPTSLVEREDLAVKVDESGAPRPVAAMYEARIELDDPGRDLLYGAPGRAKVHVAPRSLGARLAQYLERTFRFRL